MSTAPVSDASALQANLVGQLLEQQARTTALEFELARVREEVKKLLGADSLSPPISTQQLAEVAQITKEMFSCDPVFEVLSDPDEPEFPFVLYTVKHVGEVSQHLKLQTEWLQRIRGLFLDPLTYPRLRIVPQ
jgi:hypothetical protein